MTVSLAIWGRGVPISRRSPYRSYTGIPYAYGMRLRSMSRGIYTAYSTAGGLPAVSKCTYHEYVVGSVGVVALDGAESSE